MKNINWGKVAKEAAIIAAVNYVLGQIDLPFLDSDNKLIACAVPAFGAALVINLI